MAESEHLQELVAEVAAAYFSNSHVSPNDIPNVIQQIASSLANVGAQPEPSTPQADEPSPETRKLTPAQIRKSISDDALISFEDGRSYKTLRRHLSIRGMTPEQYREKWGLPSDYPMVSPNYSAARSQMAKSLGLGQLRKGRAAKPAASRGRPRKTPAA